MSRPEKNTVDYFPHFIESGRTMYIVEEKFGNDGYATWFKLLELLGRNDGHYLDFRDETQLMFIASKCKVNEEKLIEIIDTLVQLGDFSRNLWEDYKVIWNQKFVNNIQEAYRKRKNTCLSLKDICRKLSINCRPKRCFCGECVADNTQTIVEESREEETLPPRDQIIAWVQGHKEFLDCSPKKIGRTPESIILDEVIPLDQITKIPDDPNNVYLRLSKWVYGEFLSVVGDSKKFRLSKLVSWMDKVRLMVEEDKRSTTEVIEVFKFAMNDSFWRGTIYSVSGLRKNYDKIKVKMKTQKNEQRHPN